jgi:hypothetical protein
MLTYETLPEKVKDYFRKNITISVAFVKKDGTVRHMAFRRNLNAYEKSEAEKTDAQINKLKNNNLMLVYDTNLYIKAIKAGEDASKAANASYRNFRLENVLAFMCGGEVFDMRKENNIIERYGDEIAGQLTKSMVFKMDQDEQEAENIDNVTKESKNYKLMQFINEEVKKLNKLTLLENKKTKIENELKILNEDSAIQEIDSQTAEIEEDKGETLIKQNDKEIQRFLKNREKEEKGSPSTTLPQKDKK